VHQSESNQLVRSYLLLYKKSYIDVLMCVAETKPVDKRLRGYSFNDRTVTVYFLLYYKLTQLFYK